VGEVVIALWRTGDAFSRWRGARPVAGARKRL